MEEDASKLEGVVLGDRWRLVRPLAEGGMARIWIAEHVSLGGPFAVKLVHLDDERAGATEEERESRFNLEAIVAANLSRRSRHIVRVHDFGTQRPWAYLVSELVEGESLHARIERSAPLHPTETSAILDQVAKGLFVAHAAGVVHRDLKPSNVMLSRDEDGALHARILDFGVARMKERSARTRHRTGRGAILGTPSTMSPEQAMGDEIDHRADVWALACCAYEASTGQPIVDARNLATVFARLCTFDILPLRPDRPALPQPLEDVFAVAFAREIDRRYADANSFAEAFRRAATSLASGGQRTSRDGIRRLAPIDPAKSGRRLRLDDETLVAAIAEIRKKA